MGLICIDGFRGASLSFIVTELLIISETLMETNIKIYLIK